MVVNSQHDLVVLAGVTCSVRLACRHVGICVLKSSPTHHGIGNSTATCAQSNAAVVFVTSDSSDDLNHVCRMAKCGVFKHFKLSRAATCVWTRCCAQTSPPRFHAEQYQKHDSTLMDLVSRVSGQTQGDWHSLIKARMSQSRAHSTVSRSTLTLRRT